MHFADTIAIVVTRPFALARRMTDGFARAPGCGQMVVGFPFIRVDRDRNNGFVHDERLEFLAVRMQKNPQTYLPAPSADQARNRGAVVVEGAMPALFVSPTPRRIGGIRMRTAFLARVLIPLVGLDHRVRESRGGKDAPTEASAPDAAIPTVGYGLRLTPGPDAGSVCPAQNRVASRSPWSKASECL